MSHPSTIVAPILALFFVIAECNTCLDSDDDVCECNKLPKCRYQSLGGGCVGVERACEKLNYDQSNDCLLESEFYTVGGAICFHGYGTSGNCTEKNVFTIMQDATAKQILGSPYETNIDHLASPSNLEIRDALDITKPRPKQPEESFSMQKNCVQFQIPLDELGNFEINLRLLGRKGRDEKIGKYRAYWIAVKLNGVSVIDQVNLNIFDHFRNGKLMNINIKFGLVRVHGKLYLVLPGHHDHELKNNSNMLLQYCPGYCPSAKGQMKVLPKIVAVVVTQFSSSKVSNEFSRQGQKNVLRRFNYL